MGIWYETAVSLGGKVAGMDGWTLKADDCRVALEVVLLCIVLDEALDGLVWCFD